MSLWDDIYPDSKYFLLYLLQALTKKLDNEHDSDKRDMYQRLIGKVNAATELAASAKVEQGAGDSVRQV